MKSRILLAVVAVTLLAGLAPAASAPQAKNVILMIADGASFGAWEAAAYYQHGALGKQPYDAFPVKLAASTYPLTTSKEPTGKGSPQVGYDPAAAWDATPAGKDLFAGYKYLKANVTDSAAAATALSTGVKTYNNAINFANSPAKTGAPLRTMAELAKARRRSVGAITSVEWSHATPAALGGAHNIDRDNYVEIANEMLSADTLTVLMGAGHPDFDKNAAPREKKDYQYVGGQAAWGALKAGSHPGRWTLIETQAAFEALAAGPTPKRVCGTAQAATTLQQARSKHTEGEAVGAAPLNKGVPTLATMTRGALNVLDNNPAGFFLMVEGGAIDWAAHANQTSRAIEEFIDFNAAVQAVIDWVNANSNWNETLLIITVDHGNGLPLGSDSATVAFQPVVNNGAGKMPGVKWHTGNHTNELVPVFAKGAAAAVLASRVRGQDPKRGPYIDNTDVFAAMAAAIGEPVPAKAAAKAAGIGAAGAVLLLLLHRRRVA